MKPIVGLVVIMFASVALPAIADDYCDDLNRPVGCIARPGVTPGVGVGAPGVGVRDPGINQPGAVGNVGTPGVGVGAPGVGVRDPGINQPGAIGNKGPANRGGPVNRPGRL